MADIAHSLTERNLLVDETRCQLCRRCLVKRACKGMAVIRFEVEEAPFIDMARCRRCWDCMAACPYEAITWG